MLLIPMRKHKLQAAWDGPFKVIRQVNEVKYVVELSIRAQRHWVHHVNMMKPYWAREKLGLAGCGQWEEKGEDPLVGLLPEVGADPSLESILLSDQLTPAPQAEIREVLPSHRQLFSIRPGLTNLAVHRAETGANLPIRCSPFRVTRKTAQDLEREVGDMLALGVIQPSSSPWASPMVLVPKKDGSIRFCVDMGSSVPSPCPMPTTDKISRQVGGALM
ncbi:unnamed protein product [Eretmochelys imbricata]